MVHFRNVATFLREAPGSPYYSQLSKKLESMRVILEPADKAEVRALAKSLEGLGLATVIEDEQGTNDINCRVCHAVELLQKEKVIKHALDYKWIMEVIDQGLVKGLGKFDNPNSFREYLIDIGVMKVPSRGTLYNKKWECRGEYPNLTFTDTDDPTEVLRRNNVGRRFLSAVYKGN